MVWISFTLQKNIRIVKALSYGIENDETKFVNAEIGGFGIENLSKVEVGTNLGFPKRTYKCHQYHEQH